jgi:hypothetical protein
LFTVGLHKDDTNKVPIEELRLLCVGQVLERLRYSFFGYKLETENFGMPEQWRAGTGLRYLSPLEAWNGVTF